MPGLMHPWAATVSIRGQPPSAFSGATSSDKRHILHNRIPG